MGLKRSGKKIQYQQSMMVLSELQIEVGVSKAFRREQRIPNCYKYELPEGYRLVLQKVEGTIDKYLALTIGSHDEVDHYLENHKGWIFDPETHGLKELCVSSAYEEQINIVRSPELKQKQATSLKEIKEQYVFAGLNPRLLENAGLQNDKVQEAMSLTDPNSLEVMEFLESLSSKTGDLLLAYITGGQETRNEIILMLEGKREYHTHISQIILSGVEHSTDQFVNLRELPEEMRAFDSLPFEEWMLFLHPDQRILVTKKFNGPARLRGVSGSGKTVVAIHRARHLAREIVQDRSNEFVLFLTFNKSLAELVNNLIHQLCLTSEQEKIQVTTVDKWCKDYVIFRFGQLPRWQDSEIEKIWLDAINIHLETLKKEKLCPIHALMSDALKRDRDILFLRDEVEFIFGKFIHTETLGYLSCDRTGRIRRLSRNQRTCILELYNTFHSKLLEKRQYISKELNRTAFDLLRKGEIPEFNYRAIIVDEVQDLSEIELRVMKALAGYREEKLFLVGDGAQKIYTRGYSMKNLGINVIGRSFVLKKNYRNTREIMKCATLLMETQGIGKYDEDPEISQTIASLSSHSSEKPLLMIAKSPKHEWDAITREIRYLINTVAISPHEVCCLARAQWERDGIRIALNRNGINTIDYKADGIGSNNCVKISSLHNSKGHEFRVVFILGLFEGAVPIFDAVEPESLEKEAALLYVAITRAKHLLYLSYPKEDTRGQKLKGSRFLDNMKDALEVLELY